MSVGGIAMKINLKKYNNKENHNDPWLHLSVLRSLHVLSHLIFQNDTMNSVS